MISDPFVQGYIWLLARQNKQCKNLLSSQTLKRRALAKKHNHQLLQLKENVYTAKAMAHLLTQQTSELMEHFFLGQEHWMRLKQMQTGEKDAFLRLKESRYYSSAIFTAYIKSGIIYPARTFRKIKVGLRLCLHYRFI